MVSIVRHLSESFNVFFIVMMRNIFGLMFFAPQIFHNYQKVFATSKFKLHLLRNVNGLISMIVWFYTITLIPLSEAVSITFLIPIFTTVAAMFFLKEKVKKETWLAIIIGFIGVLIIVRPGFREFKPAYLLALLSALLWSFSNIMVKTMTKTEKPKTIVAYMSLIMLVISIPLALPHLQTFNLHDLFWFAALGIISNLSHTAMSLSYSKTNLSTVQPFDFSRLIFTAIISYFAFGEKIDLWVVFGAIVILCGTIIVTPKRKIKKIPVI